MHSEMWWPRLFKGHATIEWDDYEKDYSDLPAEILKPHFCERAIEDDRQRQEHLEKEKRCVLQVYEPHYHVFGHICIIRVALRNSHSFFSPSRFQLWINPPVGEFDS